MSVCESGSASERERECVRECERVFVSVGWHEARRKAANANISFLIVVLDAWYRLPWFHTL